MAIKKTKNELFSVKPEAWSKDVAEAFTDRIPIITSVPKNHKTTTIHFAIDQIDDYLVRKMVEKLSKFSNYSECYRAAAHIGVHVIYHLITSDIKVCAELEVIKRHAEIIEEISYKTGTIDMISRTLFKLHDSANKGTITFEKRDEMANELISDIASIRPDLKNAMEKKRKHIWNGDKITEVLEAKSWGGDRSE